MPESTNQMPRWNWVWFVPLSLLALLVVEQHTISYGIRIIELGWHRWHWGGLISPSAYFCEAVVVASVIAPIQGLIGAAGLLSGRRYGKAFLLIAAVVLLPLLTDALIWGSFPFNFDNAGVERLRLIPFLPWPAAPFGTY
jgi:hypothetical protein